MGKQHYILLFLTCIVLFLYIHVGASNVKEIKYQTETFAGTQQKLIGDGFPAKFGYFSEIKGMAIDPVTGDFFVGDSSNYVIRRIFASNGTITTYAGKYSNSGNTLNNVTALGNAIFKSIPDIVFHPVTYDLYVCDYDGGRILKIDRNTNIVTKVAGASSTTNASLALGLKIKPTTIAFSPEFDLHFGDETTDTIMRITSDGFLEIVAGGGLTADNNQHALSTRLNDPFVRFYNGSMYIGETACIRKRESNYNLTTIVGVIGSFGNSVGDASTAKVYVSGFDFIPGSNDIIITDGYFNMLKLFNATTNQVSIIAGNGRGGNTGDGGLPILAVIDPATKGSGIIATKDAIYFSSYKRLRVISNNTISTLTGIPLWTGHSLSREYTKFTSPKKIVMNKQGDFYVTDGSGWLFKLSSSGQTSVLNYDRDDVYQPIEGPIEKTYMTTVYAITLDANDNLYYSDGDGRVQKVTNNQTTTINYAKGNNVKTPDGDPYTSALINRPKIPVIHPTTQELHYFEGPTYIRKISRNGTIETVLGSGTYEENGFANTTYVYSISYFAFIANGDMIVVSDDYTSGAVYRVSNSTGRITKMFSASVAVSVYAHLSGSFYVLKKVSSATTKVTGNTQSSVPHNFSTKPGVFLTGNTNGTYLFFLVNDAGNAGIRKLPIGSSTATTIFGTTGSTVASSIDEIVGINPLQVGFTYSEINMIAWNSFKSEICLSYRGAGGHIFCIRNSDGNLYRFAGGGTSTFEGVLANKTTLYQMDGFTFDNSGNLYYAEFNYKDSTYGRIRKIDGETKIVTTVIGGFGDGNKATMSYISEVKALSASADGSLYVSTTLSMRKISNDGIISTVSGVGSSSSNNIPMVNANFNQIWGTSIDKSGNIYASSTYNNVVRLLNMTSGLVYTVAGTTQGYEGDGGLATSSKLNLPGDVYVTSNNDVYIVDGQNYVIRKVFANGTITTFAGSGSSGFVNGDALSSQFSSMGGIYVKETELGDEVYVADSGNYVVRRIYPKEVCFDGYYGAHCTEFDCFGVNYNSNSVCSGNGVCNNTDTCNCYDGFFGNECDQFFCFGEGKDNDTACSSFGSCISPNNCSCHSDHYGENCAQFDCYGISSNSSLVCSSFGSCIGPNNCSCNQGFYGNTCQNFECYNVFYNNSNVCSGHGSCISANNCSCNQGYFGEQCQDFYCFDIFYNSSNVCSSFGSCISSNNCSCHSNHYGENCAQFDCYGVSSNSSLVCSEHGSCVGPNNCTCDSGYFGTQCQDFKCYDMIFNNPNVCSGYGSCISLNNCTCHSNHYGENCAQFDCYGVSSNSSLVCSSFGSCIGPNNCSCNPGHFGNSCQNLESDFKCYNIFNNNSNVCSGHGLCISANNCSCNQGYFGEQCQDFKCYGFLSSDTQACSRHGNCTSSNQCFCDLGYYGVDCGKFDCFETNSMNVSVCSNNGRCYSPNNCTCSSGYYGTQCEMFDCYHVSSVSEGVCSHNGKCVSPNNCSCTQDYYGRECELFNCFGIISNSSNVCNGQGYCKSVDDCSCYHGYYGSDCSSFDQHSNLVAKFLNNYSGITFNLDYSPNYDTLNCSKLVFYQDWPLLGTNPICSWANKETNLIQVILGEGSTLFPNSKIILNRLTTKGGIQYENVTVLHADNPVKPVIIINSLNETSPCESIVVDASKSYSGDRKPVIYNWKLIQNPSGLPNMDFAEPIISINSSIAKDFGFYKFKLQIQSSISGQLSDWTEFSVYKSQVALPIISIIGLSSISTTTGNVPFTIKKTIDVPECYYEDTSHAIDWQLISGPILSFYKDIYNNLVITNFTKGNQEYQFKVTAISNVNTQSRSSSFVKIITVASPLTLTTFSSDLTSTSIKINAEFVDEEQTNEVEVWNWSCSVLNSNSSCGNSITSALTQYSSNKQSIISLDSKDYDSLTVERPKLRITLTISKGTRSVFSFTDFQFSNLPILPPTVNLIQYYPASKDIKSTDLFSLDLQVTSNGQTIDIDKYIIRQWKLNNVLLQFSDPVLNKMSMDPSTSNSIVLDASKLIQGTTNVISLNVTDIRNYQSALYSQEVRIIQPPISCTCSVNPSSGVALETTFSFACSNCQNEDNSIQLIYGFIDDKSSTYIPLHVLGETYSTKLPTTAYPLSNNVLDTFIKIVDTSTGASTEILKKVTVVVPTAKSVTEVKKKVAAWSAYEKTLQNGDSTKMIFNSAVISRTSEAMIKNLGSSKRALCQNGGVYDETIQKCVCPSEFTKTDCSMSIIKQAQINELRSGLLDAYLKSFEIRNQNEPINENVLSLNSYGLDSLLSSFDELDDSVLEKSFKVLSTMLDSSLNSKKLSPVKGVETLLGNSLNSIFSYMYYKDFEEMDNYFTQLEQNSFRVGKVLLQSRRVGEKPVIFNTLFNKVHAIKLYRTGLSRLSINFGVDSINFPSNMPLFLSEKSDRKSIILITKSTNSASTISSLLGNKKQVYNQIIGNNHTIISTHRKFKSLRSIGFDLLSVQLENVLQPISLDMQLDSEINNDLNKEKLISEYKSSTLQISNFSTISYSCMEQTDTLLIETSACNLNIRNSTFVTCDCVKKGFFIVIEHISERSEILSISQQTDTSSRIISKNPDVVAIVVPIVIIGGVICFVGVLILAIVGIFLLTKKKPKPAPKSFELA